MYVYVHTNIRTTYGKVHESICVRRVLIACEETPRKQDKSSCDLSTPRKICCWNVLSCPLPGVVRMSEFTLDYLNNNVR